MGISWWRSNLGKVTVSQLGAVLLLSLLTVVLSGLTINLSAHAKKQNPNCADLLDDNTYTCSFHLSGGSGGMNTTSHAPTSQTVGLQFFPGADTFFVSTTGNGTLSFNGECQCGAAESFEHPDFGESKAFFCLDFGRDQILTGRAKEKTIKRGQFFQFAAGNVSTSSAAVFQCVQKSNTSHH